MNLDQTISCLRFIAEHLANGLILSSAIFVGSAIAFRWLFRSHRWSASTRYQTSLTNPLPGFGNDADCDPAQAGSAAEQPYC